MTSKTSVGQDDLTGETLADRYEILAPVGVGGMAKVYRAEDRILGRTVALKVLHADAGSSGGLRRQHDEIRLLAALEHPSLVTLFDVVPDGTEQDRLVLVMQYIDGENLRSRLLRGTIRPAAVARIGSDIAGALAHIHARGIVHRDVKPANILLRAGRDGGAMLSDFGIAQLAEQAAGVTVTGTVIGTAQYLSPEQARGDQATGASDIYSLGLVLIECLTGKRSFPGTAVESATARLTRDPELPAIGAAWNELLRAMTDREPLERPTPAEVVAGMPITEPMTAVADTSTETEPMAAADPPTRTRPMTVPSTATRPLSVRRRAALALLLAGSVLAVGLLGWLATSAATAPETAGTPAVVEYAPVDGTLGEHLRRLQESVAP